MDFVEMLKQKYFLDQQRAKTYDVKGEYRKFNTTSGEVEVLFYEGNDSMIVVNLHGGGYAFGHPAFNDNMSYEIAKQCDCIVVSVNYTKSVVKKFPQGFNECCSVVEYIKAQHPNSKVVLLGQSAGAQFATSIAIKLGDKNIVDGQVLIYPSLDRSEKEVNEKQVQMAAFASAFMELYLDDQADRKNVLVSPMFASDDELKNFENVLIVTASKDMLLANGKKYYERISKFGNNINYHCISDANHGFFEDGLDQRNIDALVGFGEVDSNIKETANECLDFVIKFLTNLK